MVCSGAFADLPPGSMLVKASFGALLGPSCAHWASAEAVTNCELLCRCKEIALGESHQASDIVQHQSPSQEAPGTTSR